MQALYDVSHCNSWSFQGVGGAIQLLQLFRTIDLHSLDVVYAKLGDRDWVAWLRILTEVYAMRQDIAKICYDHKDSMLTQALYTYSQKCHPPTQFYHIASHFQKMSYESIIALGELTVNPMIDIFLALLPQEVPTDFGVFKKAVAVLIKYDSHAQIAVIRECLAGKAVD